MVLEVNCPLTQTGWLLKEALVAKNQIQNRYEEKER